jgi:hypothetical protein
MADEKVPVFISFDYDHDKFLKDALVEQSRKGGSPFSIADWSVKVEAVGWKDDARARIKRAKQVAVICGEHTHTATGVNAEIRIAREEGTPYFLLAGHPNGNWKKPTAALDSDSVYKWEWETLAALVKGRR